MAGGEIEPLQTPRQRPDDGDRAGAGGEHPVKRDIEPAGIAKQRRVHRLIERHGGGIADTGHGVGQGDFVRRRIIGCCAAGFVQRQLFQLAARDHAVAAQVTGEIGERVRRHFQIMGGERLDNQRLERPALVRIAGDGGAVLGGLEGLAQARARAEIAGRHQHETVACRGLEKSGQRIRDLVIGVQQPDQPPAAAHGDRRRLVGQTRRVLTQLGGVEHGNAEGIGGVRDDGAGKVLGALAHQPLVAPENQGGAKPRFGGVQKLFNGVAGELHHGDAPCAAGSVWRVLAIAQKQGQPLDDPVGQHLGGALAGAARRVQIGEIGLDDIIGHAGPRRFLENRLVGRKIGQPDLRGQAQCPAGDRLVRAIAAALAVFCQRDLETKGGSAVAGQGRQPVEERVADLLAEPLGDRSDVDGGAQSRARRTVCLRAVERRKAAGRDHQQTGRQGQYPQPRRRHGLRPRC